MIPGPPFRGTLSPPGDVDDVDGVVDELAAELRRQVVAAALDEQELGANVGHELLERVEVVADVLADGRVRTAAGLDGADALGGERAMPVEELGVLAREDVVGDDAEAHAIAQRAAEREDERGLAAPDGSANADREGALRVVATARGLAVAEAPRVRPRLVRMADVRGVRARASWLRGCERAPWLP